MNYPQMLLKIFPKLCFKSSSGSVGDNLHAIRCFKERQCCCTGQEVLQSQLDILSEPRTNPFEITASEVEEGNKPMQLSVLIKSEIATKLTLQTEI